MPKTPSVEIEVGFNNVAKTVNGGRSAYGFAVQEDQPSANTNVTITLPKDVIDLSAVLDPDKKYILTLTEKEE